jgi:hypothetical protein
MIDNVDGKKTFEKIYEIHILMIGILLLLEGTKC